MSKRDATYVEKTPEDVYREVAHNFDQFSPEDIAAIGGVESQHGKYSKPLQGGSARGIFQFQPQTAEYLQPGSSESLLDRNTQAELLKKYLEKMNAASIEDAYAMHNLGPTRGGKLIQASDEDQIKDLIPKHIVRANPGLYNVKTAGAAKSRIADKLAEGSESANLTPQLLDLLTRKK